MASLTAALCQVWPSKELALAFVWNGLWIRYTRQVEQLQQRQLLGVSGRRDAARLAGGPDRKSPHIPGSNKTKGEPNLPRDGGHWESGPFARRHLVRLGYFKPVSSGVGGMPFDIPYLKTRPCSGSQSSHTRLVLLILMRKTPIKMVCGHDFYVVHPPKGFSKICFNTTTRTPEAKAADFLESTVL